MEIDDDKRDREERREETERARGEGGEAWGCEAGLLGITIMRSLFLTPMKVGSLCRYSGVGGRRDAAESLQERGVLTCRVGSRDAGKSAHHVSERHSTRSREIGMVPMAIAKIHTTVIPAKTLQRSFRGAYACANLRTITGGSYHYLLRRRRGLLLQCDRPIL